MQTVIGHIPDEVMDKLILQGYLTITEKKSPGGSGVDHVEETEFVLLLRRDVRVYPTGVVLEALKG